MTKVRPAGAHSWAGAAALCLALVWSGHAGAQAALPASKPASGKWWVGLIDQAGKAYLELPNDPRLCRLAAEARQARGAPVASGAVLHLAVKPESFLPPGARLLFTVADERGSTERVFTRVVALARDEPEGACAYLAEAGGDAAGYVVHEDRLAVAAHPPRPLALRAAAQEWKSYGALGAGTGASTGAGTGSTASAGARVVAAPPASPPDARFEAPAAMPAGWRQHMQSAFPRAALQQPAPAAAEVFGQAFTATLTANAAPQRLLLLGVIAEPAAAYNTFNMIVQDVQEAAGTAALYQTGPSGGFERNRRGSFVGQIAGVVDLDGDGVDEILLRARYYAGGNLKVLKLIKGRYVEAAQTAYEGE